MQIAKFRLTAVALAGAFVLSGCAYDMYGDPYGYGYGSGVSVGIGYGGGYGGYYGGYGYGYPYGGYGYGAYDPFGWYGDYYYPGSGIFVYDRYRNRHEWTSDQRRYWEQRHQRWHDGSAATPMGSRENWSGWDRTRWRSSGTTTGNRGYWQDRSSVRPGGERVRSSGGSHHDHERGDERPQ